MKFALSGFAHSPPSGRNKNYIIKTLDWATDKIKIMPGMIIALDKGGLSSQLPILTLSTLSHMADRG